MSADAPRPPTAIALTTAARQVGATYARLRALAVDDREFTLVRDSFGKGFQLYLRRDEVTAFAAGGLAGLRRFRARARP